MIATPGELRVRLKHRVHPGLVLDLDFRLGNESGILFGASGSGKSTILRLIAGRLRPQEGAIGLGGLDFFDSEHGRSMPLRDRRVGLIFQDDLLFPHLNVAGNVRFGLRGWARPDSDARMAEVSALCGIESLMGRDPASLSGGERQRVGLARALAPRPRVLLCDEPVSALDFDARHALIDRIGRVQRAESIPVLYVTHSPDEAIALGRRLFLLEGGRIAAEGRPLDVLSARGPGEPFRLMNSFPGVVEGPGPGEGSTVVRLVDGPSLVVPRFEGPAGALVTIRVGADDILLASGPLGLVSARNVVEGVVERVVRHGPEAEVLVRTGRLVWMVGVISSAIEAVGLIAGAEVRMIVKARSCRVHRED